MQPQNHTPKLNFYNFCIYKSFNMYFIFNLIECLLLKYQKVLEFLQVTTL